MFRSSALGMCSSTPFHYIEVADLFLFATGLRKENDNYVYDSILFADLHTQEPCFSLSSSPVGKLTDVRAIGCEKDFIEAIENIYVPPRSISLLTLGVLGEEQVDFFRSILRNKASCGNVLISMLPEIEREITTNGWSGKNHIYYRARQIEVLQNILQELATVATTFPITYETLRNIAIPDIQKLQKYKNVSSVQYDRNLCSDILKVKALIHASELKKSIITKATSDTEIDYQFKSIVFAPIRDQQKQSTRQFHNLNEFLDFFKTLYGSIPLIDDCRLDKIAVLGNEESEFFKRVLVNYVQMDETIVDVARYIPKDIDYICRNVTHANYHAKRIEAYREYFKFNKISSFPGDLYGDRADYRRRIRGKNNVLRFHSYNNNLPTFNSSPIFEKTIDSLELIDEVHLFIFATGLEKDVSNNKYSCRSILSAKVSDIYEMGGDDSITSFSEDTTEFHTVELNEGIREREKIELTKFIENFSARLFSGLVFGVLGLEQKSFFEFIWPNNLFADITYRFLPLLVSEKEDSDQDFLFVRSPDWKDDDSTFFRGNRIEMFQDIIHELMMTDVTYPAIVDKNTFKNLMIPERRTEAFDDIPEVLHDVNFYHDVLNIKLLIHANRLQRSWYGVQSNLDESSRNYTCTSITAVPIGGNIMKFPVSMLDPLELWNRLEKHSDDVHVAVCGAQQKRYFNNICDKKNVKFIDVSGIIPNEIDYICHNVEHAYYHARRIEAIKLKFSRTSSQCDILDRINYKIIPFKFSKNEEGIDNAGSVLTINSKVKKFILDNPHSKFEEMIIN